MGRQSLAMQLGYAVFARVRERIARDCDMLCCYCGGEVIIGRDGGWKLATIDHKMPLVRGGNWKRYNLTCACKRCNTEKNAMTAEEYLDYRCGMGMDMSPLNMERLSEATDEQLAKEHARLLDKAHNAPKEMHGDPPITNGSMAWATFSRLANRVGAEIARRKSHLTAQRPEDKK